MIISMRLLPPHFPCIYDVCTHIKGFSSLLFQHKEFLDNLTVYNTCTWKDVWHLIFDLHLTIYFQSHWTAKQNISLSIAFLGYVKKKLPACPRDRLVMFINKGVSQNKFEPIHANLPNFESMLTMMNYPGFHRYWHIKGCIILDLRKRTLDSDQELTFWSQLVTSWPQPSYLNLVRLPFFISQTENIIIVLLNNTMRSVCQGLIFAHSKFSINTETTYRPKERI